MKKIAYMCIIISIICFCLDLLFKFFIWPSFINFLLFSIIFALIFIWAIIYITYSKIIVRLLISFVALLSCVMAIQFFHLSKVFKTSQPYLVTIEAIKENDEILNIVGSDFELNSIISGDLTADTAYFSFKLKGKNKTIRIYSNVKKYDNDKWNITKLSFKE
ncbi:cytochrome c oxidase assembly factor Coa1 family protein [Belliella kenyensis]|uniref:Cytochrome c oxidase assembly factor Coa1 family protein n=1 Tax=Belliella kenyensis TaxID=1472724 RepID=A0ABV8EJK1_9BACT|nr:cytochrome c oxidase assembly factor Coa1 family protein [Belliella kenyensis]MCH7403868.1 cytochrome c oxidase assembly factor Coa1 family protein [Belliella kenyensis]MDN3604871.1 cytochrome c oxidase assembly factor Coa1 family protein [Belliella kenyensis]